jgi:hypothetical protein
LHASQTISLDIDIFLVQQALNWLEENQDKPLEELQANQATADAAGADEEGAPSIPSGETASSLVCNECGKKFRNHAEASFHASKTYATRSLHPPCLPR